jgi:hypothetical protein
MPKIDKTTFEKLVDYVNCKYTEEFIKKNNLNITILEYSIDDPIKYEDLLNIVSKDSLVKELPTKINEWKKRYNKELNNEQLIQQLKITGYPRLNDITKALQKELTRKFCVPKEGKGGISFYELIFVVFLMVVTGFIAVIIVWKWVLKHIDEHIKKVVYNSKRLEEKFVRKELPKDINTSSSKVDQSPLPITPQNRLNTNEPIKVYETESKKDPQSPNVKYLKTIQGGCFHQALDSPDDDSYFKLININENIAYFEFFNANINKAIVNKDTLKEACEILGYQTNVNDVKNIEPGKVERQNDKWKVIQKAKIRFV